MPVTKKPKSEQWRPDAPIDSDLERAFSDQALKHVIRSLPVGPRPVCDSSMLFGDADQPYMIERERIVIAEDGKATIRRDRRTIYAQNEQDALDKARRKALTGSSGADLAAEDADKYGHAFSWQSTRDGYAGQAHAVKAILDETIDAPLDDLSALPCVGPSKTYLDNKDKLERLRQDYRAALCEAGRTYAARRATMRKEIRRLEKITAA